MIQVIDLSGFRDRQISRTGLLELIQGIDQLPCIRTLNLSNNGITDDLDIEVCKIFDCSAIKNLDLSKNCMTAKLGMQIGRKLKEGNCTHLQWLDVT